MRRRGQNWIRFVIFFFVRLFPFGEMDVVSKSSLARKPIFYTIIALHIHLCITTVNAFLVGMRAPKLLRHFYYDDGDFPRLFVDEHKFSFPILLLFQSI
jgi:hypothetical protein